MPITAWPSFTEEEALAVSRVLLSNKVNYWTGNEIRLFEQEFAEWTGVEHAVALANGTLALELSLLALGIGDGDEVIVTPRSFVASASCILRCGAIPVFADVDPDSQNITAKTIEKALTVRTKAIICVHMAGWPCDMDPILSLAHAKGLFIVEDCAQAHGAIYKGNRVGGIGHIAAWSFCQDKIMTTGGEGGMVTTNDAQLAKAVWSLKEHGKAPEALESCTSKGKGYRWLHDSLGTNGRMTEMQAAIGRIQLGRVADWVAKRQANMKSISDCLFSLRPLYEYLIYPKILNMQVTAFTCLWNLNSLKKAGVVIVFWKKLIRWACPVLQEHVLSCIERHCLTPNIIN